MSFGGDWTGCLHFWDDDKKKWIQVSADKVHQFFRNVLKAEGEIIIFSEIRKYDLDMIPEWRIPGWFGNWHEYTLVETTNWYWSVEKMAEGLFVQRSKSKNIIRCKFGADDRSKDRSEGRSSNVSFGENLMKIAQWIINRRELGNTYHVLDRNCHHFASLLHEAIVRSEGRRLDNTV
ncbi:hypothetical protein CAEBREN_19348 [Caenorhabditis brenneri]|uniref:Uncharacterized protein n=1 Tax=Caenorhabditis brenneri TaxID=135651 RepID=G0NDH0_CAEBE|nr:hypothetical protein CAEBREN_19348 [Caenorhabditis brenneri]